jgi:type II secretory ATPase GspE/PulE/Tfp pilus assembly ATPase PilB-like protein
MKTFKDVEQVEIQKNLGDLPKFINAVFDEAISSKVSDIHLETVKDFMLLRYRID